MRRILRGAAASGRAADARAGGGRVVGREEVAELRVDDVAPAAAAEDAVVAGALDRQVAFVVGGDAGAEIVRRLRLAQPGDVVQLALDGHQRRARDRSGRDALSAYVPRPAR